MDRYLTKSQLPRSPQTQAQIISTPLMSHLATSKMVKSASKSKKDKLSTKLTMASSQMEQLSPKLLSRDDITPPRRSPAYFPGRSLEPKLNATSVAQEVLCLLMPLFDN